MKPFYEKSVNIPASAGFTIIEVLIALAIFSLGIMAMGALQTASLRSTGNIAQMSEALALLDEQAEQLKALPFYVAPFPSFDPALVAGTHGPDRRGSGDQFDVQWQVVDNTPIPQQNNANLSYINGLPAGNHTVSKTITVWVTRAGFAPRGQDEALAIAQFVKTWAAQIPPMP
ncbi:MAG: prepilin-type N-terminal cleavage/methylation domain-containing protein [Desulfobacteraceae bacterium]|nr:MAG: prepilin-type N-terminal cleavage/methylation domain-containing protein [Desulfobacteraceae bacterium]